MIGDGERARPVGVWRGVGRVKLPCPCAAPPTPEKRGLHKLIRRTFAHPVPRPQFDLLSYTDES